MTQQLELNDATLAIFTMFAIFPCSYVIIDFNYAEMSIENLMPTASDRGKFKVLAKHKAGFADKCNIDYFDGFPRYYFVFDCMIQEVKSWIEARAGLVINDIILVNNKKEYSIRELLSGAASIHT